MARPGAAHPRQPLRGSPEPLPRRSPAPTTRSTPRERDWVVPKGPTLQVSP
jgi:hypothetical protein